MSYDELLAAGLEPEQIQDPNYVPAIMALEGAEHFDSAFFGFGMAEADRLDPQKRIFLECAWEALESGALTPASCDGAIGVFAGSGTSRYFLENVDRIRNRGDFLERLQAFIDIDKDHLATQVSYKLNLNGPSLVVQTACSTSLVAVHMACQSLLNMECDIALAGGVSVSTRKAGYLYQEGGVLSKDGRCRSFDADATGTIFAVEPELSRCVG